MDNFCKKVITIPSSVNDITSEWIQTTLGHSVLPETLKVESDIQAGTGFLSSIYRVSYKTIEDSPKIRNIIIKLLPKDEESLKFIRADEPDERELKCYSIVLPDLLEVIPEIKENICEFYGGAVEKENPSTGKSRASMLILEDLKPLGFEMMNFSGEASDKVVNELINFLAKLHFGALAVEQKKGIPLPELYPFMQCINVSEKWVEEIVEEVQNSFPLLEKLLKSQNIQNSIWQRYSALQPYARDIVKRLIETGKKTLLHGDVWPSNIQIHESLPLKIIDWQLMAYRDVVCEISLLIYTVLPSQKLTRDNVERLLKKYFDEFETFCENGGEVGKKIKRREWEEFKVFFFTWGVASALVDLLTSIHCFNKDLGKYANIFRVMCEVDCIAEFLIKECI